jgi:hypothetical protein
MKRSSLTLTTQKLTLHAFCKNNFYLFVFIAHEKSIDMWFKILPTDHKNAIVCSLVLELLCGKANRQILVTFTCDCA